MAITAAVPAVPAVVVAAGAAAGAAVVATAAPARAASGPSVLVLLQNGESTAPESTALTAAGYAVTQVTPAQWLGMTAAQFEGYAALVIGDPSSGGSCSTLTPTTATTGTDAIGTTWQQAVSGNVAVLGTAPALPASTAAKTLITDTTGYAAAGFSSSKSGTSNSGTGLYVSLNCGYSTAAAGTSVPLLDGVEGIGAAGSLAVQGSLSCTDPGNINAWEAATTGTFTGFSSSQLTTTSWGAGCPVDEGFTTWPSMFTPLAYDASSDATQNFTASNGTLGQPYVLLGAPVSAATAALAPSAGGEVPAGTTAGGTDNTAAPGVRQATAGDPVNTENGDFTQSGTDLSAATFGPPLDFTRSYDATNAQQQTATGTPGAMGYGWTDNWATSLSTTNATPGDIYVADGLRTDNGNGGPGSQSVIADPTEQATDASGNVYITDTVDCRVQEIPAASGTQWGIPMTAGDIYTVAGSPGGQCGASGNETPATQALLDQPSGVAANSSGLFIADSANNRVVEIAATTGTQFGIAMTAGDMYVIAGQTGTQGISGDGGPAASSKLYSPVSLHFGSGSQAGDLYIADFGNNRIQEIAGASQTEWGQTMTAGDMYTVAGSSSGTAGDSGNGTAANTTQLNGPSSVTISNGDLYVADTFNCRIAEIPSSSKTEWTVAMAAGDLYTVAGHNGPANCTLGGDAKPALQSSLNFPTSVRVPANGNMYIADSYNNRVQEVAGTSHTEFGQSMTAADVYTIAGSSSGTAGNTGDGGLGTSALLSGPQAILVDSSGNIYISDSVNNQVRELSATTSDITNVAGNGQTLATTGAGGPAVTAGLSGPSGIAADQHGDIFIADTSNNRVQEIAAYIHTQFGIAMTAGDVYTIAGTGIVGDTGNGGKATSAELNKPFSVAVDGSGNVYMAELGDAQVREIAAATGNISTFAGSSGGTSGDSGNGGPATSALLGGPTWVAADAAGNVFITDSVNNQVLEVPASSGTYYGITMSKGDIYILAGSTTGTSGSTGNGGKDTSALLNAPYGLALDTAGNLYIADSSNNEVREIAEATHAQWGQAMTAGDIYDVAGSSAGASGNTGDGGRAASAHLTGPEDVAVDASGDLYIADTGNNRVREVAAANGTQRGQAMTGGDIYDVAGKSSGAAGNSGNGGPGTAALMFYPTAVVTDQAGNLYITEDGSITGNNTLQVVTATSTPPVPAAPGQVSSVAPAPGGITITQPGGAQVTFYPQSGGACASPYVTAGGYCALPLNQAAVLTSNTSNSTYTFTPSPGAASYTYSWTGQLVSEADQAGNTLTITYNSPAPGSGNCPAAAASCQTVTAANGRTLVIGSNSSGLVTSVTDPLSRTWTYAYNTSDQLTSATDPMSHVTSYTYGPGTTGNPALIDNLLTITSPNAQPGGPDAGDATVNTYDSQGRVISQTDPMGYTTSFNYCVNQTARDCMNPATGTGFVTVTDPDGNKTTDYYLQGTLAADTKSTGGTINGETDFNPLVTAGVPDGGTLLDASSTDGNGVTTTYSYNAAGSRIVIDGPGPSGGSSTTTNYYTSFQQASCTSTALASSSSTCRANGDGGPAPVAPGGVITPPSSAPPAGDTWALFDTDGNQLYTTTGVYQPGSSSASYLQTTYQLFKGNTVTLNGSTISCASTPPSATLPCATINGDGVVTQLGYDPAGDLTSTSTADGNGTEVAIISYAYDGDGEQTSETAPDGNLSGANAANYTAVTAYNADGQKSSVTVAGGTGATVSARSTSYTYDGDGNELTVKDARGNTTTTAYNADNQATTVTDPLGNVTLTCYDSDGNAAQTVPASGVAANHLTAASCPVSYPGGYSDRLAADATVTTYNAAGEKTAKTTPAPAGQSGYETTTYAYDGDGNVVTTTAPADSTGGAGVVTTDTYTPDGQRATQTTGYGTPAAATTSYCYDPLGDETAVVMPDGNTSGTAPCETSASWTVSPSANPTQAAYQTTYSYDSVGEQVSTTTPATTAAPNGATTTASYDPAGQKLTSTDPGGVTTTYTYTPLGKEASVTYSGSSAPSVTYTYDADGSRTKMTDATGTSSYSYDPFGEPTSQSNGAGQAIGYAYNATGNVTSITYPLPSTATWATTNTISYGYNNADRLTSVTNFTGSKNTITPNADGQQASETLSSTGDTVTTTYDPAGSPASISLANSGGTLQSFTYSDAPSGNILSETDRPASSQSPAVYSYDGQGRVASLTPGTGTADSYAYDASGNLTTLPAGATGTYNNGSELASSSLSATTTSYTYNSDGERLVAAQGTTTKATAAWNGAGSLTSYADPAANMTSASYNGDGLRQATTTAATGTQNYTWDTQSGLPRLLMDGTSAYIYTEGTAPAEQVNLATGAVTYLVTDSLGSVRGIVSNSGALTAIASYDAWGNPQTAGGLTATTPFGFAGGYTDPTGLSYLINRYYDPSTGQFLSVDPDVSHTHQPYAYATGNPVSNIDPTGLDVNRIGTSTWAFTKVFTAFNWYADDCTDFASEALHWGGGRAYYYGASGGILNDMNWEWWPNRTHSWTVARELAVNLLDWGGINLPYYNSGIHDGYIIFANLNGGDFSGIDHAGVVTGIQGNGMPYITQHSPAQRNVTLQYWFSHGLGGHKPNVWIIIPTQD